MVLDSLMVYRHFQHLRQLSRPKSILEALLSTGIMAPHHTAHRQRCSLLTWSTVSWVRNLGRQIEINEV